MADTFKGIITADGKKRQLPYANVLEAPVSDKTLSKDGGFADAKVTGDNFAKAKAETDSLKGDLDKVNNEFIINLFDGKFMYGKKLAWFGNTEKGFIYKLIDSDNGVYFVISCSENTEYTITKYDESEYFRIATCHEYPIDENKSITFITKEDLAEYSITFTTNNEAKFIIINVSSIGETPRLCITLGNKQTRFIEYGEQKLADLVDVDLICEESISAEIEVGALVAKKSHEMYGLVKTNATSWRTTDYIYVGDYSSITFDINTVTDSALGYGCIFFDEVKNPISSLVFPVYSEIEKRTIKLYIPDDAVYFRTCIREQSIEYFTLVFNRVLNEKRLKTVEDKVKDSTENKYSLSFETVVNNQINKIVRDGMENLILVSVKYHKEKGKIPFTDGYLYLDVFNGFKFYYADSDPNNLKFLFDWNFNISYNNVEPLYYSAYITPNGDVLFVRKADAFDDLTIKRLNPIIYKASNNYMGEVIQINDTVLPCSGVQNCAYDISYVDNSLFIAEYVRAGDPEIMNVWKIAPPYDSSNCWKRVLTIERSDKGLERNLKHFHGVYQDTFSDVIYAWTGDDDNYSRYYQSSDNGENWTLIKEGPEKHTRVLNMLFLEDGIYWATDGGKHGNHYMIKSERNPDGTMDVNSFTEIFKFPDIGNNNDGDYIRCSTYASCYIKNPNGILFLDKYDVKCKKMLNLYFYSFDESKAYVVANLKSTDVDVEQIFGFRNEAVSFYPCINKDNSVVCGFGVYPCNIDVLNNTYSQTDTIPGVGASVNKNYLENKNKVNNLIISVNK